MPAPNKTHVVRQWSGLPLNGQTWQQNADAGFRVAHIIEANTLKF